jgi:glycerol-3-phosphate acyltransferase PlsY
MLVEAAAEALPVPSTLEWVVLPLAAYLFGSIPSAHLIARSHGVDLGKVGSGNYGATNLGRTLGRRLGITCFVLDALKGALPVLGAGWLLGSLGANSGASSTATAWCWLATAFAAIFGHTLSPWIRFKGGKGVATGFGALAAMWPVLTLPAAAAIVLWLVVVSLTRLVALASMIAAASVPCSLAVAALAANGTDGLRVSTPYLVVSGAIALFVIWKHRSNIARMRAGAEDRVGNARTTGEAVPEHAASASSTGSSAPTTNRAADTPKP